MIQTSRAAPVALAANSVSWQAAPELIECGALGPNGLRLDELLAQNWRTRDHPYGHPQSREDADRAPDDPADELAPRARDSE